MQLAAQRTADPKKATAGLRGASWTPGRLPADARASVHTVATQDGAQITGFLHARGGEKSVVSLMHPRELIATHYLVPEVLLSGSACWVQGSRSVGNDVRLEHEIALFDVAAGLNFLRGAGFEHLTLLGNSGGAALFALYIQQSGAEPSRRFAKTPGGRPTKLAEANLPLAERLILIAPHLGPGKLLQNCIDPSVTDEADALAIDASLFAFSKENGFQRPPESARYSPQFLERYRQAQRERVARIDASARASIEERLRARGASKEAIDLQTRIRGVHTPIFQVWRTDADPEPRSVRPQMGHGLGRRSAGLELRQHRLWPLLHRGELAFHLVGALLECLIREMRARDRPADADDRLHGRQHRVPGGCGGDLRQPAHQPQITSQHPR